MNKIHTAILTSVLLGVFTVVFTISLISPGGNVLADTVDTSASADVTSNHPELVSYLPTASSQSEVSITHVEDAISPSGSCSLSPLYPQAIQQWCSLIMASAAEHSLDANLLAAVMLQESGGNPDAYSKSGAVGLLQVMPKDGIAASFQCKNGPCFNSRPSSVELFEPEFNIEYGTRMLAGLVNRYGSVRDALMAYGPMEVGYYYADKVLAIYQNYQ